MSAKRQVAQVRSFHSCRLKWRDWALLRMGRWLPRIEVRALRRLHVPRSRGVGGVAPDSGSDGEPDALPFAGSASVQPGRSSRPRKRPSSGRK